MHSRNYEGQPATVLPHHLPEWVEENHKTVHSEQQISGSAFEHRGSRMQSDIA